MPRCSVPNCTQETYATTPMCAVHLSERVSAWTTNFQSRVEAAVEAHLSRYFATIPTLRAPPPDPIEFERMTQQLGANSIITYENEYQYDFTPPAHPIDVVREAITKGVNEYIMGPEDKEAVPLVRKTSWERILDDDED